MSPKSSNDTHPYDKGKYGHVRTHGKMPCEVEGRDCGDTSTSQELPEARRRGTDPSLVPSEKTWSHQQTP
jgi:hypothetical protein